MPTVIIGNEITITVTIISPNPELIATGIVVLQNNGVTIGTQLLSGGSTVFSIDSTYLGIGDHNFIAYYAGDTNFAASASLITDYIVANPVATTSTLTSNINPANFGQNVIFTCVISSSVSVTDGMVQLYNNSNPIGAPVTVVPTPTGATANIITSGLTFGLNYVHAVFTSTGQFLSSTSNTITENINLLNPTITLVQNINPSSFDSSITFTATVSGTFSTPIGTVTFKDGNSTLGSVALSGGVAAYTTPVLAGGTHSITAVYGGGTVYMSGTSSALSHIVNAASTSTVCTTNASGTYPNYTVGSGTHNITFTATVTSPGGTPDGFVCFLDTGSDLNSPLKSPGILVALNGSGIATTTQTFLAFTDTGDHPITATFIGNSNYGTSIDNIDLVTG